MAVSAEFAQAVRDGNLLKVRIMLKDSLIIDRSFGLFAELLHYTENSGLDIWMTFAEPAEYTPAPWTEDTMNYELTALVNDFTKEHVNYVKKIIREVCGTEDPSPALRVCSVLPNTTIKEAAPSQPSPKKIILDNIRSLVKTREACKKTEDGKIRVTRNDVEKIRTYAKSILDACDAVLGRH